MICHHQPETARHLPPVLTHILTDLVSPLLSLCYLWTVGISVASYHPARDERSSIFTAAN